ncbi:uncharacterized protein LOC128269106 [Anopheles cruzii]|uniref:uncharacterized protein LOC128269106 n=1 Tax=Anopheles cruzii TaxID=68878 RepID=UPI0022EC887B|nr:uncharacterized protein LOC128269106 [Anopheles cruzii]XP_052862440.1 uncharacterized protein LOC128269106 [Anopheles cruzii]
MDFSTLLSCILLITAMMSICDAHECYVCSNQTGNTAKCLNTVKICEQGEDACLTEIRWGSMPYFSLGAQKQFYVSKRCAKKEICQRIRTKHMPYCTHIWYEDWTCSACCLGDRCNYYVISDATHSISFSLKLFAASLATLFVRNALQT